MLAEAKNETLLYAFGGDDAVYVFDFKPPFKQVGYLAQTWSKNMCSDDRGNVFLTQPGVRGLTSYILEYVHGGLTPIAKLQEGDGRPYSCAFNPKTGELAVINICQAYDYDSGCTGVGSIDIYKHEQTGPTKYAGGGIAWYYFAAYDTEGNLYFDGVRYYGDGDALVELRKNKTFNDVSLGQVDLTSPGGVQWSGSDLVLGDFEAKQIYELRVTDGVAKDVGLTPIADGFAGSLILAGKKAIVSNGNVYIYPFPKGGSPIEQFGVGSYGAYSFTLSMPRKTR